MLRPFLSCLKCTTLDGRRCITSKLADAARHPNNHPKRRWLSSSSSSSSLGMNDTDATADDDKKYSFLHILPWQFLRSSDSANFDEITCQRNDVLYDHNTGKPEIVHVNSNKDKKSISSAENRVTIDKYTVHDDGGKCNILWSDGLWSEHDDIGRLEQHYLSWKKSRPEDRIIWKNLIDNDVRQSSDLSFSFDALIADDGSGMSKAIKTLYQYGILLITKTPVDDNGAGIAALGSALSGGSVKDKPSASILVNYKNGGTDHVLPDSTDGPLRTLFGSVWATSSSSQPDGTSVADSAYGSEGLPLHTDLTYIQDPPGLQIFTMVQPAPVGGESVFCDAFAVAEKLKSINPNAFDILSNTIRTYHSKDNVTGWYLKASGPVIEVRDGRIVGIRHNDLDRLPDLPPNELTEEKEIDEFYDNLKTAHAAWDALIAQDTFRLVMKLNPGDTMVVANQVSYIKRNLLHFYIQYNTYTT